MNSLKNIDTLLYLVIALAALVFVLIIFNIIIILKQKALKNKYESFMIGKNGRSMEETVLEALKKLEMLNVKVDAHSHDLESIFNELEITFQKIGLVKYDAFNEMGGKLSFALTLLNKDNNGFIINSIQSREGCYTYIKEITGGKSYIDLGTEENKSLEKALSNE